jgi:hypothetical protein
MKRIIATKDSPFLGNSLTLQKINVRKGYCDCFEGLGVALF